MFKNYLKIALRNLKKQKGFTFINVFGLAAGIMACIFISTYVQSELNYDKHHNDSEKIFRINTEFDFPDQKDIIARNSVPFGPQLKEDYPEVRDYLRIYQAGKQTVRYEDRMFIETEIGFADSTLLEFFDYKIAAGTPESALDMPKSVIISDKKAVTYFGNAQSAIDKFLEFQNNRYRVTAVFKTPEEETHLPFEFYISFNSLPAGMIQQAMNDYMWMLTFTYIKVNDNVSEKQLKGCLQSYYDKRIAPWIKENNVQGKLIYHCQPLTDIHLNTNYSYDVATNGNPLYISIFSIAGVFILIIACFNYLNLITARSIKRAKEVGLRKVLGAAKRQLIYQFMGESFLVTFIAYIAAFVLVSFLLPVFNNLTDKNFTEGSIFSIDLLFPLLIIFLFISIISGSYPAFYLSRFEPSQVLKIGSVIPVNGRRFGFIVNIFSPASIRKFLVILQFAISIILIVGTIFIFNQFNYMRNKELGFNKDQVLVIDIPGDTTVSTNLQTIKNELLSNVWVKQISTVSNIPGTQTGMLYFNVEQEDKMADKLINFIFIDDEYLKMMDIPIIEGRSFSKEFKTDIDNAFIINKSAAQFLGWREPLEKKMVNGLGKDGKVIGVTKDFNYSSLHNPISPLVMMYAPVTQGFLLIKVSTKDLTAALKYILNKWDQLVPKHPADYFFLDDNFDKLYSKEKNMLSIFSFFAALAIIISCMGLFSLASFIAEQKTKEIGIRKVLGASVPGIAALLSKDFIKLVAISNIIAIPVSYYAVGKWLENFAYRVHLSAWVFVIAALTALLIAAATISWQSIKSALSNPVNSLKYE